MRKYTHAHRQARRGRPAVPLTAAGDARVERGKPLPGGRPQMGQRTFPASARCPLRYMPLLPAAWLVSQCRWEASGAGSSPSRLTEGGRDELTQAHALRRRRSAIVVTALWSVRPAPSLDGAPRGVAYSPQRPAVWPRASALATALDLTCLVSRAARRASRARQVDGLLAVRAHREEEAGRGLPGWLPCTPALVWPRPSWVERLLTACVAPSAWLGADGEKTPESDARTRRFVVLGSALKLEPVRHSSRCLVSAVRAR